MQTIYIDIQQRGIRQIVHAKQADAQSRFFKVILLDGGATFTVPTGAKPSIWFDGSVPGWYDTITLANGTTRSAFSVSGNEITCELAEQAVSSSGTVLCCLMLNTSTGYQLGAWNIAVDVEAVPAMDSPEATEYFNAFAGEVADALNAAERAEEAAKKIDPDNYYTKTESDEIIKGQDAKIDKNKAALNGYKILDVGVTGRLFATGCTAGTAETITVTVPDMGQTAIIPVACLEVTGTAADGIFLRTIRASKTQFNLACITTKALATTITVKAMYVCVGVS